MADGIKILAQNKKAWHDYFVLEQLEAGIALIGTEVKSIRNGGVNLKDSFCTVKDGELLMRRAISSTAIRSATAACSSTSVKSAVSLTPSSRTG